MTDKPAVPPAYDRGDPNNPLAKHKDRVLMEIVFCRKEKKLDPVNTLPELVTAKTEDLVAELKRRGYYKKTLY